MASSAERSRRARAGNIMAGVAWWAVARAAGSASAWREAPRPMAARAWAAQTGTDRIARFVTWREPSVISGPWAAAAVALSIAAWDGGRASRATAARLIRHARAARAAWRAGL